MILTEKTADRKVDRLKAEGLDIEWDGWDINIYQPNPQAMNRKNGAYRNGEWAIKKTIKLAEDGKWYLRDIRFKK